MVRNKMENCLKWGRDFLNFAIKAFLFAAVVYIMCRLLNIFKCFTVK
jgi:hypothetical protein